MKRRKYLVLFTLFLTNLIDQPAPEVVIEQGILSGKISPDGSFFEYVGIPYATSNINTRFKAPLPPPSWNGVFKAVEETSMCPQASIVGIIGSEDCLTINVYIPALARKPLPVMVYVHGGAFVLGSGGKLLYAPDFLVKHDVILVTFNYRLGALGFMCLGIKDAPGNAGLKDQIAALRWVKKNIAAFGGDVENITLFGQSAGGTSVSLLLASEATSGLFKKAIVMSGSAISSWAINRQPIWIASLVAKELGYNTDNPNELYEIFSKIPFKELVRAKPEKPLGKYLDTQLLHLPCIEKNIPDVEPALTDLPYNLLTKKPKKIPVMYGSTSKEGLLIISKDNEETVSERDSKYLFASDLEFQTEEEAEKEDNKARQLYFNGQRMSMNNIMNISDLMSHLYFEIPPILESEITLSTTADVAVFNYYFNYSGGRNFLKYLTGFKNETGACHGDELLYLFRGDLWPFPISRQDKKMIDWMTKLWSNFAKYGDPTPEDASDLPIKWVPSKRNDLKFLYIEDDLSMGTIPSPEAYRLWKYMYEKYRKLSVDRY